MLVISRSEWGGTEEDLRAGVEAFRQELAAHAQTVGIPAPWPRHPLFRGLAGVAEFSLEPPPEPETPQYPVGPEPEAPTVTMRQARLALRRSGMLQAVDSAIAGMEGDAGEDARIEWEYAQELRRDHPLVQALTPALGLTAEQLDDLFALANTL